MKHFYHLRFAFVFNSSISLWFIFTSLWNKMLYSQCIDPFQTYISLDSIFTHKFHQCFNILSSFVLRHSLSREELLWALLRLPPVRAEFSLVFPLLQKAGLMREIPLEKDNEVDGNKNVVITMTIFHLSHIRRWCVCFLFSNIKNDNKSFKV